MAEERMQRRGRQEGSKGRSSFRDMSERDKRLANWTPKTELGKKVMAGQITDLNEILDKNLAVLEPEIIDKLLDMEEKVVDVKKTTRVIESGRKFAFRATVLTGNKNGFIGLAAGKDKEKWPAVRKASGKARMHITKVRRGCGSWECACGTGHSVPFKVTGKSASVRVTFLPAPKGVGLVAGRAIKDVLVLAGITDVWTTVKGATDTRLNFIQAAVNALSKTTSMKVSDSIGRKAKRRNEDVRSD